MTRPHNQANSPASKPWAVDSWQALPAYQQPEYADQPAVAQIQQQLAQSPGLVSIQEIEALKKSLKRVSLGEAFLLQGGDCAESFAAHSEANVEKMLRVLVQMAVVLTYGAAMPVVKIARIAGQYAKPRSSDTETINGQTYKSYRGDIINALGLNAQDRMPDPKRMLTAYQQSVATLNTIRSLTHSGLADLSTIHQLNLDFAHRYDNTHRFLEVAQHIEHAMSFMTACGVPQDLPVLRQTSLHTSHESLLLPYETAFIRQCPQTGEWYNRSAHFVWIGDRTRQLDGAHVELMRGLSNPIGMKVGPSMTATELVQLCHRLNPNNTPGHLTLITRFGHTAIERQLPQLIERIKAEGIEVIWSCDPMHGNTQNSEAGRKTRHFDHVLSEVKSFLKIHKSLGTIPGGIHLELTGDDVTECLGGAMGLQESQLNDRYLTQCDPRLNFDQSLELAFQLTSSLAPATSPLFNAG